MTWICYRGIEISARVQYVLLAFEVIILLFFAGFALVKVYTGNAEPYSLIPQWNWFNPFRLDFGQTIAPAMLTAIFIYWGWDTAVSINEETKDPEKTPGRAAVISTLLLLAHLRDRHRRGHRLRRGRRQGHRTGEPGQLERRVLRDRADAVRLRTRSDRSC